MSEEITKQLLQMVTDISEAVHKTQQDVAVMKAQQEERKESQEKEIRKLQTTQEKQGEDIADLKKSRDKISVTWALLAFTPSVIAAICAVITLTKR